VKKKRGEVVVAVLPFLPPLLPPSPFLSPPFLLRPFSPNPGERKVMSQDRASTRKDKKRKERTRKTHFFPFSFPSPSSPFSPPSPHQAHLGGRRKESGEKARESERKEDTSPPSPSPFLLLPPSLPPPPLPVPVQFEDPVRTTACRPPRGSSRTEIYRRNKPVSKTRLSFSLLLAFFFSPSSPIPFDTCEIQHYRLGINNARDNRNMNP